MDVLVDEGEVRRFLTFLMPEGAVIELRNPNTNRAGTISGYFNSPDLLIKQLRTMNGDGAGTYVTVNPVMPDLLARANNKALRWAKCTTSDREVVVRRFFPIDVDAVRPTGISANDEEHAKALQVTQQVREFLRSQGWPEPIFADSGNGGHLLNSIDLPNDKASAELLKACLEALDKRFTTPEVKIDPTVFNAARIWKLYGTMARKGENIPVRPHRMARMLDKPQRLQVVTEHLMRELARKREAQPEKRGSTKKFDLAAFIDEHSLPVSKEKEWEGGTLYELETCPFNPEHKRTARITQNGKGALGFQCFHDSCNGNDWQALCQLLNDVRESPPLPTEPQPVKTTGEDSDVEILPAPTLKSVVRILTTNPDFRNIVFYDDFFCRLMTASREWADAEDLELTIRLQRIPGLQRIGTEIVRQGAMTIAFRNRRHCVRDWVESLIWDGVSRIKHFFEDYFGVEANSYTRAASQNFWISMIARAFSPGCQVDNMIVLEGPQGIRKSAALRVIGGEWFTEQHESATGKGFFEVLQGKLLVEISEMDSFSRAEVTKVKQIITCTSDRFRESYGRHAKDHPRQCIFVGSTNKDDWNADVTGARRFWPIACRGDINVEAIQAVREQCFAEAAHRFKNGATWWEMPAEETKSQQEARFTPSAWVEPIQRYIENEQRYIENELQWAARVEPLTEVSVAEILKNALEVPEAQWNKANQMQVAECLRWLKWKRDTLRRNGKPKKLWLSPLWLPPVTT